MIAQLTERRPSAPPQRKTQKPYSTRRREVPTNRPPTIPQQADVSRRPSARPQHTKVSTPILTSRTVPGGMCLRYLEKRGVVTCLTNDAGYMNSLARTVYGRCLIVQRIIPPKASACGTLALWIWRGGQFPAKELHILSNSHYRARVFNRTLVAHNRRIEDKNLCDIAGLTVTSPLATACDLCCLAPEIFNREVGIEGMILFLYREGLTVREIAEKVSATSHMPGSANAKKLLRRIAADPRSCILIPLSEMRCAHV